VRHQRLPDAGRVNTHSPSHPGIHADESLRLDFLDVDRVRHRDHVVIQDENGNSVKHTPEFVTSLFDEELNRLLSDPAVLANPEEADRFRHAREISEAMIVKGEFNPV